MSIMQEQALQLYNLCDLEKKGYITKQDMNRLQEHLPLSMQQLASVFDSLDDDGNGSLTISEFTDGFGYFLTGGTPNAVEEEEEDGGYVEEEEDFDLQHEEEQFKITMKELGATETFDEKSSLEAIKEQWLKMRRKSPELLPGFETLLGRVCDEILKSKKESKHMETALRSKMNAHDEDVRKLYEEMENQIKTEKERLLTEERTKERKMREELEVEIRLKDQQYQEMVRKQDQMAMELEEMNSVYTDTAQERERLEKEKQEVEKRYKEMKANLKEAQAYITDLNKKSREEKRKRARAAIAMTENIALERESMVREMDQLKEANKKLEEQKIKKLAELQDDSCNHGGETIKMGHEDKEDDDDQGPGACMAGMSGGPTAAGSGILALGGSPVHSMDANMFGEGSGGMLGADDDVEVDDISDEMKNSMMFMGNMTPGKHLMGRPDDSSSGEEEEEEEPLIEEEEVIEEEYAPEPPPPETKCTASETDPPPTPVLAEIEIQTDDPHVEEPPIEPTITATTNQESYAENSSSQQKVEEAPEEQPFRGINSPQRMFKVVFVGDSGVGKSSILFRFSEDSFKSTFSATIGVDFMIKSMLVDDYYIALQLWDTAGQERFRSITKQYYRKADAVVVVYDTTHEASFNNVHNWMQSVKDGTEDGTVIMLLGNKADLAKEGDCAVKLDEGKKLAEDYEAIFHEVSAKSGEKVPEAFLELAKKLKLNEDKDLSDSIHVKPSAARKKGCCG